MKLFNKSLANKKLKSPWGEFHVDKDGCVAIHDKEAQDHLLSTGFTSEDGEITSSPKEVHSEHHEKHHHHHEKQEHKPKWQRSKS